MAETHFTLNKGSDYDNTGSILRSFISSNLDTYSNIRIDDTTLYPNTNARLTNCSSMFANMNNVKNIDISKLNTANVTNAHMFFQNCHNLVTVSNFDARNIIDGLQVFYECTNIIAIPPLNLCNAINLRFLFGNCVNLTTIGTMNVDSAVGVYGFYANCKNLVSTGTNTFPKTVNGLYKFADGCSKLTGTFTFGGASGSLSSAFNHCSNLQGVYSNTRVEVTDLQYTFWSASKITHIFDMDLTNCDNGRYAFDGCHSLTSLNLYGTSMITNMGSFCGSCVNLVTFGGNLQVPKITSLSGIFYECNNLSSASLKTIANMCISAVNCGTKNCSNSNYSSPLYGTNKQINISTVGSDIISRLSSAGWSGDF